MSKHHVIYISGVGDHRPWGQDKIIKFWRLFGVVAHFLPVGWANGKDFEPKLSRITQQIDHLSDQGFIVSLVGVSAGASAALNAFMIQKDKIHKVVFICGKLHSPDNVNPRYFIENPSFEESLKKSDSNVAKLTSGDKSKMLYMHGLSDVTVSPAVNKIDGVPSRAILAFGHIPAIYVAITFYSRYICRFLKQ